MKVLGTKDAKKRYISEIKRIDVVQEMQLMTWTFCLSTELWEKYSERKSSVNLVELKKITGLPSKASYSCLKSFC